MINCPGVMIYAEVYTCVQQLDDLEAGMLFRAILEYAFTGAIPSFSGSLAIVWALVRPAIDRDRARYSEKVLKAEYAVYVRDCKRNASPKLSYISWKKHRNQTISDDIDQ